MIASREHLTLHVEGAVAFVELNRPRQRNALSRRLLAELQEVVGSLRDREDVRVVRFGAAGPDWSVGADLNDWAKFLGSQPPPRAWARQGQDTVEAIASLPQVVVAAARGHVIGGGLLLYLAADLRLAAKGAKFSIPEIELGIPLGWSGVPRLVREVGPTRARDLLLTGRRVHAREAFAMGLVTRLVDEDALDREVGELTQELVAKPGHALQLGKRQLQRAVEEMVPSARPMDSDVMLAAMAHPDFTAAVSAYLARLTGRG
jgi:enoyl-CoA hydratase/carnithine racemase